MAYTCTKLWPCYWSLLLTENNKKGVQLTLDFTSYFTALFYFTECDVWNKLSGLVAKH